MVLVIGWKRLVTLKVLRCRDAEKKHNKLSLLCTANNGCLAQLALALL